MDNIYTTATIIKVEKETAKVKNFYINCKIEAKPGQYIMLWLPREGEKPFAVGSVSPLLLSIAKVGEFSEKIHQLKKGDKVTFRGPYGTSFTPKGKKILLVGGGYGMVPFYLLASLLPKKSRKFVTVVDGARTKNDLVYVNKFKKLGVNVEVSTDDGSSGFKGFSTDLTSLILEKEKFNYVAACGPMKMMEKVAVICKKRKIPCQVSVETHFKCGGIGLCGECSFHGCVVCKEGPIFPGEILLDYET